MSTAEALTRYTPEDLLSSDFDGYELVNGELVEIPMGYDSSWVGGRLYLYLTIHVDAKRLGWTSPADTGYQCFPNSPNKVRKPDVSFIRAGRLSADEIPKGHCRIPPDLAAEVISLNDIHSNISEKVREYLDAGVKLVWVVDPTLKRVNVYRADGSGALLGENDDLTGENVIDGFSVRVGNLFQPPV